MSNVQTQVGALSGEGYLEYVTIAGSSYTFSISGGALVVNGGALVYAHLAESVTDFSVIGHAAGAVVFYITGGVAYRSVLPSYPSALSSTTTIGAATSLDGTLRPSGHVLLVYSDLSGYAHWMSYADVTTLVTLESLTWYPGAYTSLSVYINDSSALVTIVATDAFGTIDELNYTILENIITPTTSTVELGGDVIVDLSQVSLDPGSISITLGGVTLTDFTVVGSVLTIHLPSTGLTINTTVPLVVGDGVDSFSTDLLITGAQVTSITLTSSTFDEGLAAGTTVATVQVVGLNMPGYTLELLPTGSYSLFTLSGNELKTASVLDYDTVKYAEISLQATPTTPGEGLTSLKKLVVKEVYSAIPTTFNGPVSYTGHRGLKIDYSEIVGNTLRIRGSGFHPIPMRKVGDLPTGAAWSQSTLWYGNAWIPHYSGTSATTYDGWSALGSASNVVPSSRQASISYCAYTGDLVISGAGQAGLSYRAYGSSTNTAVSVASSYTDTGAGLLSLFGTTTDAGTIRLTRDGTGSVYFEYSSSSFKVNGMQPLDGLPSGQGLSLVLTNGGWLAAATVDGRYSNVGGSLPAHDQSRVVVLQSGATSVAYSRNDARIRIGKGNASWTPMLVTTWTPGVSYEQYKVLYGDFANPVPLTLPAVSGKEWRGMHLVQARDHSGNRGFDSVLVDLYDTATGLVDIYEYHLASDTLNLAVAGTSGVGQAAFPAFGRLLLAPVLDNSLPVPLYEMCLPAYPLVDGAFDRSRLITRTNTLLEYDLAGLAYPSSISVRCFERADATGVVPVSLATSTTSYSGDLATMSLAKPFYTTTDLISLPATGADGEGPTGQYLQFSGAQALDLTDASEKLSLIDRSFSFSMWFEVNDAAQFDSVSQKYLLHAEDLTGNTCLRVYLDPAGVLNYSVVLHDGQTLAGYFPDLGTTFPREAGWHHFYIYWSGGIGSPMIAYLDGRPLNPYGTTWPSTGSPLRRPKTITVGSMLLSGTYYNRLRGIRICGVKFGQAGSSAATSLSLPTLRIGAGMRAKPGETFQVPLSHPGDSLPVTVLSASSTPIADYDVGAPFQLSSDGLLLSPLSGPVGTEVLVKTPLLVNTLVHPQVRRETFTRTGGDAPISWWTGSIARTTTPYGYGCQSTGGTLNYGYSLSGGQAILTVSVWARGLQGWWYNEVLDASNMAAYGGLRLFSDAFGFRVYVHNKYSRSGYTGSGSQVKDVSFAAPSGFNPSAWHHHLVTYNLGSGVAPKYYLDGVEQTGTVASNDAFTYSAGNVHTNGLLDTGLYDTRLFGAPGDGSTYPGEVAHLIVMPSYVPTAGMISHLSAAPTASIRSVTVPHQVSDDGMDVSVMVT